MRKLLLFLTIILFFIGSAYPKEILPLKYWLDKIKVKYNSTVEKLRTMEEADESCYDDEFISEKIHCSQKVIRLKDYMTHIETKLAQKKAPVSETARKESDAKTTDIKQMFFFDEVVPIVCADSSESKQVIRDIERRTISYSQAESLLLQKNADFYLIKDLLDDFRLLYKAGESMDMIIDQIDIIRDMTTLEDKPLFTIREEDAIRQSWISFLCHRKALLIMIGKYRRNNFYKDNPSLNRKVMFLYYGAVITLFRNSLKMINMAKKSDMIWDKLNEKDIAWDIEKDQLQSIYKKMAQYKNRRILTGIYNEYRETFADELDDSLTVRHWLHQRIRNYIAYIEDNSLTIWTAKLSILWDNILNILDKPRYSIVSAVEEWVGDNRYMNREIAMGHDMIQKARKLLQPGDFLLSRKNYYLSNIFLGGFWPHGILYVGTVEDLKKIGISEHPTVKKFLVEYSSPGLDGYERLFIESTSEGVRMVSAETALHADYLCAFRPQVSPELRNKALIDAFTHVGKDYDYDFDFFSSEELACTEVLYQIYSSDIPFEMTTVLGKKVLPGNQILQQWARQRNSTKKDFDYVFFIDQNKADGVFFSTPDELARTLDRSGIAVFNDEPGQQEQKSRSIFW